MHTTKLVFKDHKTTEQTQKIRNKYLVEPLHVVRNQASTDLYMLSTKLTLRFQVQILGTITWILHRLNAIKTEDYSKEYK